MTSVRVRLEGLNHAVYIAAFVAIKLLIAYLFSFVAVEHLGRSILGDTPDLGTNTQRFITLVFLAPLVETYLFQYLFFEHLSRYLKNSVIIFLSALVFGLGHSYNSVYMLYAFFSGLLYSAGYYYRLNSHPYVIVFLIHCIYSLLTLLLNNR
jgi:membrane protease YdiL (CAAX protease family)